VSTFGRLEVLVHVRRGDEFLVLRRTDFGYWHAVAGGVEDGEDWRAAALRELQEETGLTAVDAREIGTFEYLHEEGDRRLVHAFVVDAPHEWEPVLDFEHDVYRWCGIVQAESLLRYPEPKELLRAI
jgi:8-oxo-dGTP pyrophosphatase MutT (NUDIX family)